MVTRDKIKDIKVEFWKDDSRQDALCTYRFKGWISNFETTNPPLESSGDLPGINHMLVVDLEPVMNQQNFQEIAIGN